MPMGRARLQEELLATGCPEHIMRATLRATYRKVNEQDLAMQVVMMAGDLLLLGADAWPSREALEPTKDSTKTPSRR